MNNEVKSSQNQNLSTSHTNSISVATSSPRSNIQINARRQITENPEIETIPLVRNISDVNNPPLNKFKVRTEASAMMLASIVILFMITHSFRIALKVSELASPNTNTIEKFKICYTLKR